MGGEVILKKKNLIKLGALLIIIALIILGVYFLDNPDNVRIGDVNFKVPEGYTKNEDSNQVNLTNGVNSICISKNIASGLEENVNHYINVKTSQKLNVTVENFTVGNVKVVKLDIVNDTTVHYLFDINGKVYDIFTWNKNQDTDSLVTQLINSVNGS